MMEMLQDKLLIHKEIKCLFQIKLSYTTDPNNALSTVGQRVKKRWSTRYKRWPTFLTRWSTFENALLARQKNALANG